MQATPLFRADVWGIAHGISIYIDIACLKQSGGYLQIWASRSVYRLCLESTIGDAWKWVLDISVRMKQVCNSPLHADWWVRGGGPQGAALGSGEE